MQRIHYHQRRTTLYQSRLMGRSHILQGNGLFPRHNLFPSVQVEVLCAITVATTCREGKNTIKKKEDRSTQQWQLRKDSNSKPGITRFVLIILKGKEGCSRIEDMKEAWSKAGAREGTPIKTRIFNLGQERTICSIDGKPFLCVIRHDWIVKLRSDRPGFVNELWK